MILILIVAWAAGVALVVIASRHKLADRIFGPWLRSEDELAQRLGLPPFTVDDRTLHRNRWFAFAVGCGFLLLAAIWSIALIA